MLQPPNGAARRAGGGHQGNPHALAARATYTSWHMVAIIVEGVLFVALVATAATLLCFALLRWTPLGLRLRQDANRRKIESRLDLECPIHGLQREEAMVRLPSGTRICPACYQEALHE